MPTITPKTTIHALRNKGAGLGTPALIYAHTEPNNTIANGINVPERGFVIGWIFIFITPCLWLGGIALPDN